ncbi:MAG: response regulator [Rhodospirillales bacterium]|nr:response regulator [Rhodospirillales bacterium]
MFILNGKKIADMLIGGYRYEDDITLYRRVGSLNILMLVVLVTFVFFLFVNIFIGKLIPAVVDCFVIFLTFYSLYLVRRKKMLETITVVYPIIVFIALVTIVYLKKNDSFELAWTYAYPIFAIPILGLRIGMIVVTLFYTVMFPMTYLGIGDWNHGNWNMISFVEYVVSSLFFVIVGFMGEITINRAQRQIEKAKESAVKANLAKSQFLSSMSHEIRTPMNAIIGMTHLTLQTDLTSKQNDYVNNIFNAANSLLGIINDILDFSKIEAGKIDMESVPFRLSDVLEKISSLMSVKVQEKGLELLISTRKEAPNGLVGDPLRLSQILTNLVNNAVKFTDEGEIVLRIEHVETTGDQVTLKFSVTDSGIGMSEEQMNKVFQSFGQAEASTTRKYGGTGLGLTISRELTGLMGGEFWAESKPGEGSSFIFTAKFGLAAEMGVSEQLPKHDVRELHVLVVDDSPVAREIIQQLAENFFFNVETASGGEEALGMVRVADKAGNPFKLVFMDWKMPGMDGIEACRMIKSDAGLSTVPRVVMVSAYERDVVLAHSGTNKIDGYLAKPVMLPTLLNTAMVVLGYEDKQKSENSTKGLGLDAVAGIGGAHILLVEDNLINQKVALELLKKAQIAVTIAENGKEAVEKVQQETFDCVLMDIQMPVMDGYEATRTIRQDERFKDLPIIAMTANAMVQEIQECKEVGMNGHIAKPIDPPTMYTTLAKWLEPSDRKAPSELLER